MWRVQSRLEQQQEHCLLSLKRGLGRGRSNTACLGGQYADLEGRGGIEGRGMRGGSGKKMREREDYRRKGCDGG